MSRTDIPVCQMFHLSQITDGNRTRVESVKEGVKSIGLAVWEHIGLRALISESVATGFHLNKVRTGSGSTGRSLHHEPRSMFAYCGLVELKRDHCKEVRLEPSLRSLPLPVLTLFGADMSGVCGSRCIQHSIAIAAQF